MHRCGADLRLADERLACYSHVWAPCRDSYGRPAAPGTLVCCDGPHANLDRRLSKGELEKTAYGHTRALSCQELLFSLSWCRHELPRFTSTEQSQRKVRRRRAARRRGASSRTALAV